MSEAKHTPGPWVWRVDRTAKTVSLMSSGGGWGDTVVDAVRWGFGGATLRWNRNGLMYRSQEIAKPYPRRDHHAAWILDIDHPDAHLMKAAPDLLAACEKVLMNLDYLRATWGDEGVTRTVADAVRAAVAKAKRGQP